MAPLRALAMKPTSDAVEPAPSNPTSLLWAHQIKREHGFLLDSMRKIESEVQTLSGRVRSMGATTADMKGAIDDVNKLKESIADIITSDRETKNWIASADTRVQKLQKDIETTSEIRSRVSELDRGFDKLVASVLKASSDLQSNLDRIEKVEDEMKEKISELGDRFRTNYQDEARDLRFRLETIESKHSEEARQMMAIQNEIVGLKQTSKAYSARNTELNAGHKSGSVPRDYPLLSTEASTEFLRSSNSGYLQVLASPPSGQMNTIAQRTFREESPTLSAQMRRVSRIARPPIPRPRASQHNAQILTVQTKSPSLSETPDLDAPYRQSQVATTKNAWRIHSRYEPRQTRSQRKKTNIRACPAATQQPKRKIVVLKVGQGTQRDPPLASFHSRPASRLVQLSYSNKPSQAGLTTQSPTRRPIKTASKTSGTKIRRQNPKRRQRREIAQLEDLDTFMAACPP